MGSQSKGYMAKLREQRKAEGKCPRCGHTPPSDWLLKTCPDCRDAIQDWKNKRLK